MTDPITAESTTAAAVAAGCPFHTARTLPVDGTPLRPSPTLAAWREEAPATPLRYDDDSTGWIVTHYDLARAILEDLGFSQQPQRMPRNAAHGHPASHQEAGPTGPSLDERALAAMDVANLLGLDGDQHLRIRRSVTSRFSVRSVRGYQQDVHDIVARQLDVLRSQGSPADLTAHFAQPISALVHSRVLGIPDSFVPRFFEWFVGESSSQQKVDFLREVLDAKREDLGDDVLSDLLRSDLSDSEVEGVTLVLFTSGRDSVAYMIATSTVALLTHPEQLVALRDDPTLTSGAIEEFMRVGAMFVTLFPRTAKADRELGGIVVRAGESVSVSPVAANHDASRFDQPDDFDITRDAFGHLGFGHGVHGCVGQQLARLEIREAITQLLAGLPGLHLVHADQLEPLPFANPVATYEAGSVIVGWQATISKLGIDSV